MAINPENVAREFGWDDEISNEGSEFRVLPEGDYNFTIVALEKARHQPKEGGKLPACNKAIVTVRMSDPEDGADVDIKYNLFLHSSQEWKLCEFFCGIGQKKKGEPLRMNWNAVIGETGMCHVKKSTFKGNDNNEHDKNEITKWHEKQAPAFAAGKF